MWLQSVVQRRLCPGLSQKGGAGMFAKRSADARQPEFLPQVILLHHFPQGSVKRCVSALRLLTCGNAEVSSDVLLREATRKALHK